MKRQLTKSICLSIFYILLSNNLLGQWKQVNGPFTGDVQKIVYIGSVMYASVFKAGIYKSVDEGNNWHPVNTGINPGNIMDIASNDHKVFLATNEGVFVLSDNESQWNKTTIPSLSCTRLTCSGDTIYAGDSDGGVYISKNGGTTWSSRVLAQSGFIYGMTAGKNIAFTSKDLQEIYYSINCGATWAKMNMGPVNSFSDIHYKNSRLYLVNDNGVFTTKNKGGQWEYLKQITNARKISVDGNNIAVLSDKLYLSSDTGKTWKSVNLSSIYNTSVLTKNNQTFLMNYKDGIFKSTDQGDTWKECNQGINGSYVKSLVYYKDELLVSANGKVYSSPDLGKTWKFTGHNGYWITVLDTVLLASTYTLNFIHKGKDDSWTIIKSRLNTLNGLGKIHVDGSAIYVGDGFLLLKSVDGGEKWDTVFNYLKVPDRAGDSFGLEDVLIDGDNIYIAGSFGGLFQSTDKGVTWKQIRTEKCNSIKKYGNNILLGSDSGIFSSNNNGESWSPLKLIYGVQNIEIFNGSIIMTAYDAVYISFDGGAKWRNYGVFPEPTLCLSTFAKDSTVYCGSYYKGIFSRPFKDVLTFKAQDKSRFYGSTNPEFTYSVSGFTNGDNITNLALQPTGNSTATSTSEPGIYSIILKGGKDSAYIYNYVYGNLTVKKAPLNVIVNNKTKKFGDTNPSFDFAYSGFVNGENEGVLDVKPVITCQSDESSSPGSYAIVASGGSDNNYEFIYTNGTLTINSLTNVAQTDKDSELQIFPNPANDFISLKPSIEKPVIVKIIGLDGRIIIEKVWSGEKLDISILTPGVYFLKIDEECLKFIKN